MRLIDAEELRKAFKKSPVFTEVYLHYARQLIDDAPTVEPTFGLFKEMLPLISKYQHNFVSSPIEVVKVDEPLSNSDEISKALEKGDIYKRGFEYGYLKGKEERPNGEWIKTPELFGDRICSHCGKQISHEKIGKFCIECGADMRGGTE